MDVQKWAEGVLSRYGPRVAQLLGVDQKAILFVLSEETAIAEQRGDSTIYLNPRWFAANQDEGVGAIVHEIAHWYSGSGDENLADAARYAIMGEEDNWSPTTQQRDLAQTLRNERPAGDNNVTATPTPSPSPTDPGDVPGGTSTVPAPTSVPVSPPNEGDNNTPSETGAANELRALIEALVGGKVAWKQLTEAQKSQIVTAIGLDPAGSLTSEQIEAAAKAYLTSGSADGAPATTTEEILREILKEEEADPWATAIGGLYASLWGEPAPQKWLDKQLGSDKNLWEMELGERSKPAFMHTKIAQNEYADKAASLSSALGLR